MAPGGKAIANHGKFCLMVYGPTNTQEMDAAIGTVGWMESTFSGLVNVSGGSLQTNNIVLGEMAGTYGELSVAGGNVTASIVIVGQGSGALGTIGVTDGSLQLTR